MKFHPEYLKLAGAQALFFITVVAGFIGVSYFSEERSIKDGVKAFCFTTAIMSAVASPLVVAAAFGFYW